MAELQDADLVIVGVFAPVKDDDEEEDDAKDEEEEVDPIAFAGKAKELDEALGGALTDLAAENGKEFQNGGEAGSATPVMRVMEDGKVKFVGFTVFVVSLAQYSAVFLVLGSNSNLNMSFEANYFFCIILPNEHNFLCCNDIISL